MFYSSHLFTVFVSIILWTTPMPSMDNEKLSRPMPASNCNCETIFGGECSAECDCEACSSCYCFLTANCDCDGGKAWHGDDQVDVTFSRAQIDRNNEFSDFVSGFESKPSEGVARDVLQIIDAAERDNMREYEYIAQRLKTNFLYLPEEEQDQINEWLTDRDLQKIFL